MLAQIIVGQVLPGHFLLLFYFAVSSENPMI